MPAAPTLDSLKEGNDNATKISIKAKGSGSARLTTEHSLYNRFGIAFLASIDKTSGSETIAIQITARNLRVQVNDSGSYRLANIGSNTNDGKVGSGLDEVNIGHRAYSQVGLYGQGFKVVGGGDRFPPRPDTLSRGIVVGPVTKCHGPSRNVLESLHVGKAKGNGPSVIRHNNGSAGLSTESGLYLAIIPSCHIGSIQLEISDSGVVHIFACLNCLLTSRNIGFAIKSPLGSPLKSTLSGRKASDRKGGAVAGDHVNIGHSICSRLVWWGAGRFPVQPIQCSPVIVGCHVIRCHRRSRPGWLAAPSPPDPLPLTRSGWLSRAILSSDVTGPVTWGAGRSPRHPIHLAARSPPRQSPDVTGCHGMSCHGLSRLAIGGLTDPVKWVEGDCDRS